MKTKLLFILLGLTATFSFSQIVSIPDPNFKQRLIDEGVDQTGDGEIQIGEAEAISFLNLRNGSITDLTGIEAFVNLYSLYINNLTTYPDFNAISNVDLAGNVNLEYLYADNAEIETINVVNCVLLKELYIQNNMLEILDISNNAELTKLSCQNNTLHTLNFLAYSVLGTLDCSSNQLTNIDISTQTYLIDFLCHSNTLINLNIHNMVNEYFTNFDVTNNSNLSCITVDDENNVPQIIQDGVDDGVSFSNSCSLGTNDLLIYDTWVFPNPVDNFLTIETPSITLEKVQLSNIVGEIILTTNQVKFIDFSDFDQGIYFLRLYDFEGNYVVKKIIKK